MKVLPPNVKPNWDECGADAQAMMIAYSQLRNYEEIEDQVDLAKIRM